MKNITKYIIGTLILLLSWSLWFLYASEARNVEIAKENMQLEQMAIPTELEEIEIKLDHNRTARIEKEKDKQAIYDVAKAKMDAIDVEKEVLSDEADILKQQASDLLGL